MRVPTIVVLAAGLGSRYGGVKQMAAVGTNGEWLLDFSLYDAWQAGFRSVVFIIRPELKEAFQETIGKRLTGYFDVSYAEQTFETVEISGIDLIGRKKPLGTGHALLCAKHYLDGPFAVINADDYYGPIAFHALYKKLVTLESKTSGAMVAYKLGETLSENGSVSRGICAISSEHQLIQVSERTGIGFKEQSIQDEFGVSLSADTWISMNIWGLQMDYLNELEVQFSGFLENTLKKNPLSAEFYLPESINQALREEQLSVEVLYSEDRWTGMTYEEDLLLSAARLQGLQQAGVYPETLWGAPLDLTDVLSAYNYMRNIKCIEPINRGHINLTYKLNITENNHDSAFILQKINTHVFKNPDQLMANIEAVTKYVRAKGLNTLDLIHTTKGDTYTQDKQGGYWRLYKFVENSIVPSDQACIEELYAAGCAFGKFQKALQGYPANTLNEVLPDFHHTPKRYNQLLRAVAQNPKERVALVRQELAFAHSMTIYLDHIVSGLETGTLPLRVTHNDTKVNNVLLSNVTGEGICVIDLDTVMPGSLLYDYGDGIRSTVTGCPEDEGQLNAIKVDKDRFEAFTSGFVTGLEGMLTEHEQSMLLWGAILMTYECGIRFLTDYILGDVYFKIDDAEHNLRRARAQFKLVQELLDDKDVLESIIVKCIEKGVV